MTTTETDRTNRITTDHDIVAMVALDTIQPLAERITRLLSHGRRIAIAHRHATYLNDAPEVHAGLTIARNPKLWDRDGSSGFHVALTGDSNSLVAGFGFSAYPGENCDTEDEVWRRYHGDRRRNMTEVRITGGTEGFGPGRSDRIMIRRWNENGVCDETVIAFDNSALNATAA